MGERASFVTEHIHCAKCFDVVRSWLVAAVHSADPIRAVAVLRTPEGQELPIVAGSIKDYSPDLEWMTFDDPGFRQHIEPMLCHPVTVIVVSDCATWVHAVTWRPTGDTHDDPVRKLE